MNRRFVQLFAVYALFYVIPSYSEMLDMRALCVPSRAYAKAVNADIDSILRDHPGQTIEMGYGANPPATGPIDRITSFRTRLVLAGNPLTVDVSALFDMQLSGVQIPQSTTNYLASCGTNVWLIPHGPPSLGKAFTTLNPYALVVPSRFLDRHLFPDTFRATFSAYYTKSSESRFFDVWSCSPRQD